LKTTQIKLMNKAYTKEFLNNQENEDG